MADTLIEVVVNEDGQIEVRKPQGKPDSPTFLDNLASFIGLLIVLATSDGRDFIFTVAGDVVRLLWEVLT